MIYLGYSSTMTYSTIQQWARQKIYQAFEIFVIIDEFRTSQTCPCCSHRLYNVRKRQPNGKLYTVRGLKWCNQEVCKGHALWDRDVVACKNIRKKGRGQNNYPAVMGRDGQTNNPFGEWGRDTSAGTHILYNCHIISAMPQA